MTLKIFEEAIENHILCLSKIAHICVYTKIYLYMVYVYMYICVNVCVISYV